MSECSSCKKMYEEIYLTWKQVKGKMKVYCDECIKRTEKDK